MSYRTVKTASEIEIVIQKSRFIGRCFPVQEEAQALQLLADICRRHWDARHNCYAYSLGERGAIARYSDDGEPGGTAGQPMMQVLAHQQLTDVLCVVTRYFGGVLLGTGGLVRAYSQAASEAVRAAGIVRMERCTVCSLAIPYQLWGVMENLLRSHAMIDGVDYAEQVSVRACVPVEQVQAFVDLAVQKSDGRVRPVPGEICYRQFPDQ